MAKNVRFYSEGEEIAAVLYEPDASFPRPRPAVILCHGFQGIKEMIMPEIAPRFTAAGYYALAFDYRHFGESGGKPRNHLIPAEQVRDIQNCITYMESVEGVAPDRIALWGSSMGGANAIYTAGVDRRVRAVVALMPVGNGRRWLRSLRTPEAWEGLLQKIDDDRRKRVATGEFGEIWAFEVMTPDSVTIPFLKEKLANVRVPKNVTIQSVEEILNYSPEAVAANIAPRPLLIVAIPGDRIVPNEEAEGLFAAAREPKKLLYVKEPSHHWSAYWPPSIDPIMKASLTWLEQGVGERELQPA